MKVLFVGDINPDLILGGLEAFPAIDKEVSCTSFEKTMGSTVVISACAYAGLGGSASVFGLVGDDEDGDFMLRGMAEYGIDVSLVRRTGLVGTGVTVNLIFQGTRTQVTYPGTMAEFDGSGLADEELAEFSHVHFAGPYQQTRFRPRLAGLLRKARSLGLSASLDPQWDASEEWEYMSEWLPLLSYLFVNRDEALSISRTSTLDEAASLLARKTSCVAIKNGAEGALVRAGDRQVVIRGLKVEVVDPTGAGDVFNAAFLYSILNGGADMLEAGRFANAAAARSCGFVGGVSHRSSYADVVEFLLSREPN